MALFRSLIFWWSDCYKFYTWHHRRALVPNISSEFSLQSLRSKEILIMRDVVIISKVSFSHPCYKCQLLSTFAIFFKVLATEPHWWELSIGSCIGLAQSGNKPLRESVLTQIYLCRHMALLGHNVLTHLTLVPHICVSKSGQHWFR